MRPSPSRRAILRALAGVPPSQSTVPASGPAARPRRRVPVEDLVNTFFVGEGESFRLPVWVGLVVDGVGSSEGFGALEFVVAG